MVRICPERDAVCPHGDNCQYAIDRYKCRSEEAPVAPVSEPEPVAWQWRTRIKGGFWDAWESGKFGQECPPFMEYEERALFTSPPDLAVENARLREAQSNRITALDEVFQRWCDGYPFNEDSEEDQELRARAALAGQKGPQND